MAHAKAPARNIEEFLRRQKKDIDIQRVQMRRDERRDRFVQEVTKLFNQIKTWLNELAKEGPIFVRERPIQMYEEGIGTYELKEMLVDVGDRLVIIRPIGTMISGGVGRVDVLRSFEVHLIMKEWGKWQIARREYFPNEYKPFYTEFTQEEFKELLFLLVAD